MPTTRSPSGLTALVLALALAGCAADTSQIRPAYVSTYEYDQYSCERLRGEAARTTRKLHETGARVDKTAADDDAQTAVGLVLFWPTLFFLEGEETVDTAAYAELKGHMNAIEDASIHKNCGIEFKPLPEGRMHEPTYSPPNRE